MTAEIQGKAAILLGQNSQSKLKELIHPIRTLDTQRQKSRVPVDSDGCFSIATGLFKIMDYFTESRRDLTRKRVDE